MKPAGYSKRLLIEKLGLQPHMKAYIWNEPKDYTSLLGDGSAGITFTSKLTKSSLDFIHAFYTREAELKKNFPALATSLRPDGMLWISWPKGRSGEKADLNENSIRDIGLSFGLVDIKVIAVDETWSGLKFVYRKENR